MKKMLIILFFAISSSLFAKTVAGVYYLSPTGSNSNSGEINSPWLTLSYACAHATTSGDIIHINVGTYIETEECVLAVGVSIEGVGSTSWIKSHYKTTRGGSVPHASIRLSSSPEGTNGNQHISGIKLDGDALTGSIGITVWKRSNVIIHDCTIVDFFINGVTFEGFNDPQTLGTRATGNEIYNCIMSNCGEGLVGSWDNGALIQFGGQDGMLIHDNTLSNTSRAVGHNSKIVNGDWYNQGCKYYNNISYKPDYDGASWNFHIEHWNCDGGFEVYGNEFHGGDAALDVGGAWNHKGSYDYSWYIHNNLFTGKPVQSGNGKGAICIEGPDVNDVWIYKNHFLNLPTPIGKTNGWEGDCEGKRIYICYNIMENCGWEKSGVAGEILEFLVLTSGSVLSDVYIYNNVILSDKKTYNNGIRIENSGTITNFNIKNNIICYNYNGAFLTVVNSNSINGLFINNNVLYSNVNSNDPRLLGNAIVNYEFSSNIKSDPLFISSSDFHLTPTSPCINKGADIDLTSDYDGIDVANLSTPDIGAFQFNVTPTEIKPTENNSTIKVYPNPVPDELIIEIEGNTDRQSFEILDSTGRIVFKGYLSGKTVVPTTNFSPGVYLIKTGNGRSFEFKKIIKV